ncbi:MAG: ATP-binding protein [Pseudonocardiaceae bacterium]
MTQAAVGLPAGSSVQTVGKGGGSVDTALDVTVRRHGQVVVVHPRGSLTLRTSRVLHRVLVNELLGNGRVVVDLDGFHLEHAPRVMMFPAVLAECGGWPAVKVALCRPEQEMAQALSTRGVSVRVPVYHLLLEAEAEIDRRPDVVRTSTRLPGNVRASATARQLVRELCPLWQVDDDVQDTVQVVVSELVGIAVAHSNTAAAGLTLERGPGGLRVSVEDSFPASYPQPEQGFSNPLPRGLGLEMLKNLTTSWGMDIQLDGKTAWAEIAD